MITKRHIEIGARSLLHVMIFFAVIESVARFDDHLRWNANLGGTYDNSILMVSDSIGPRNRPGASYEKWSINSHGFRGPEIQMQKPEGVKRIIIAGASETFGLYEGAGGEFPAKLQLILDSVSPGAYEVINAASAGMTLPRIADYYQRWLVRFQPDILIVYPSPAFYLDETPPEFRPGGMIFAGAQSAQQDRFQLRFMRKITTVAKKFLPVSIQTEALKYTINKQVKSQPADWVWQHPPVDRLNLFREHATRLAVIVKQSGVMPMFVSHADRFPKDPDEYTDEDMRHILGWRKYYPRASEQCLLATEQAADSILYDLSNELSVQFCDARQSLNGNRAYFADFSHFTDTGALTMAELLSESILQSDLYSQYEDSSFVK